jgi:hypothetical protein
MLEEIPAVREEEGQKNKILQETLNPNTQSMDSTTLLHRSKNWRDISTLKCLKKHLQYMKKKAKRTRSLKKP